MTTMVGQSVEAVESKREDSMNDTLTDVNGGIPSVTTIKDSQKLKADHSESADSDTKMSSPPEKCQSREFFSDPIPSIPPAGELIAEHTGYSLPPSSEDDDDAQFFPSMALVDRPPPELFQQMDLDNLDEFSPHISDTNQETEQPSLLRNSTDLSSQKRPLSEINHDEESGKSEDSQFSGTKSRRLNNTTRNGRSRRNRNSSVRRKKSRVRFGVSAHDSDSEEEEEALLDDEEERWDDLRIHETLDTGNSRSSQSGNDSVLTGTVQPMKRRRSQRLQNSLSALVPIDMDEWKKQESQQEIWVPGFKILKENEVYGLNYGKDDSHSASTVDSNNNDNNTNVSVEEASSSADSPCEFCRSFVMEDMSDEIFDQRHYRAERRETLLYDHLLKLRKQEEQEKMRKRRKQRSARASSSKCNSPSGIQDSRDRSMTLDNLSHSSLNGPVSLLTVDDVEFEKSIGSVAANLHLNPDSSDNNNDNSSKNKSKNDGNGDGERPKIPRYVPKKFHRPEFNYPIPIIRIKKHGELYRRKMMNEWCKCGKQSLKYKKLSEEEELELKQLEKSDWFKYYPFSIRRTDLFCNEEVRKDPSKLQNAELKTVNRKRLIVMLDTLKKQRISQNDPIDIRVFKECLSLLTMFKDNHQKKKNSSKS